MSNEIAIMPSDSGSKKTGITRIPYLISIDTNRDEKSFISIDKPEFLNGFIGVKGIFSLVSEEYISKEYYNILAASPKDNFVEVLIPINKINFIKNLIYRQK